MVENPALFTSTSTVRPRFSTEAARASRSASSAEVADDDLGADAVGGRQLVGERPQALLPPGDERDAVASAAPAAGPGRTPMPDEAPVMRQVRSGAGGGRLMAGA